MSRVAAVAVSRAGSALAVRIAAALPPARAYIPQRFLASSGLFTEPPTAAPRPFAEPLTLRQAQDERHPWHGQWPQSSEPERQPSTGLPHRAAVPDSAAALVGYEGRVAPLVDWLFSHDDALVLIMAAGAAVRLIGPLLHNKSVDPAVVVVDDAGRFVISLIGGHAAGANRLATRVAAAIGATPVLTTATEPSGAPDIERLAGERGWRLAPDSSLTRLLAALVNGERVGVVQDAGDRSWLASLPGHVATFETIQALEAGRWDASLIVTDRAHSRLAPLAARSAVFHPPVLVLGIGCSRGVAGMEIARLIDTTLGREGLSPLAVAAVATIDRREDEPGLRELLAERGWPLCLRTAAELAAVIGDWTRSETVRRAVGTAGVAEPAALAVAGVEQLTVRKVKTAHATLAIARAPVEILAGGGAPAEEING